MNKKWAVYWLGVGVWLLIGAILGSLSMWTATSNIISDSFLKVVAIFFGAGLGFGAIVFLWVGIKEWRRK